LQFLAQNQPPSADDEGLVCSAFPTRPLIKTPYDDPEIRALDEDGRYEVEGLLDSRVIDRVVGKRKIKRAEYLVKWAGFVGPTWEPFYSVKHLTVLLESLREFKEKEK